MDYNHITSFLSKITNTLKSSDLKYDAIQDGIFRYTNKKIPKNNLSIKSGVLIIKESPTLKNEIFIKKNKIIEEIKKNGVDVLDIK